MPSLSPPCSPSQSTVAPIKLINADEEKISSSSLFTSLLPWELPTSMLTPSSQHAQPTSEELSTILLRACTTGDLEKLNWLFKTFKGLIDINRADDDEGITALMAAACYGHLPIVRELIKNGSALDARDKYGWTALHWAVNSNHEDIVSYLLDKGCSFKLCTESGKSIKDFLERGHLLRAESMSLLIFKNNDTMSLFSNASSIQNHPSASPANEKKVAQLVETMLAFTPDTSTSPLSGEPLSPFHWETCLPDEMLVLKASSFEAFFNCTFHTPRIPSSHLVVADLWFLAVRYIVYYQPDLLPLFFNMLLSKASACATYISTLTMSVYWFYTWYRFVHYLKRDPKVYPVVNEALFLDVCMDQLQRLFIYTLGQVNAELDRYMVSIFTVSRPQRWKKIFNLTTHTAAQGSPVTSISSLLVFLSALLKVLQVYQVHGLIVHQLYVQIFQYLNFKFHWHFAALPVHSRTLALEWRMQWSQLEAWAHQHSYLSPNKDDFINPIIPFTGLLQFVHVWTQWSSLDEVFELTKTLELWKPILKKVLPQYRFQAEEEASRSLFKECLGWLEMEPETISRVWHSSPLVLPPDFGEPLSENDWLEANEPGSEERPTLTLEWLELLAKNVP